MRRDKGRNGLTREVAFSVLQCVDHDANGKAVWERLETFATIEAADDYTETLLGYRPHYSWRDKPREAAA